MIQRDPSIYSPNPALSPEVHLEHFYSACIFAVVINGGSEERFWEDGLFMYPILLNDFYTPFGKYLLHDAMPDDGDNVQSSVTFNL